MSDGKFLFNVSLPFPNFSTTKPIEKPGLVELACNTHTWMRGYLVVTEELSAVSGADGKFKIEGVPAGPHDLRIWHEALKVATPVKVTVKDGETVNVDVTLDQSRRRRFQLFQLLNQLPIRRRKLQRVSIRRDDPPHLLTEPRAGSPAIVQRRKCSRTVRSG